MPSRSWLSLAFYRKACKLFSVLSISFSPNPLFELWGTFHMKVSVFTQKESLLLLWSFWILRKKHTVLVVVTMLLLRYYINSSVLIPMLYREGNDYFPLFSLFFVTPVFFSEEIGIFLYVANKIKWYGTFWQVTLFIINCRKNKKK